MPYAAPRPCTYPGCPGKAEHRGRCAEHQVKQFANHSRPSAVQRGYGDRWRKARLMYLSRNPLCVHCLKVGRLTTATVVDHIVAHRGNADLMWDQTNWQALCQSCHEKKTRQEINERR